ncbi:CaiB/BaiF CoA transferase family protein [Bordetella bronchiseptica]|uniref:CaiB/BaiF CoA transferase family protein n=1 Tax=Bordetella bronchiseptica TaxID=518 RepID=UPI000461F769|nr:CoA transferase [Bordetella bronchiseptica]KDD17316.1 CoA-transferase family III protein [Bordetella bronchiseptica MBORD731]
MRNAADTPAAVAAGSALDGIRVVDLSRVLSGPYCTQILADHGADVVKIEPPGGDETRAWGPPFAGEVAAYYQGINRNKRGAWLDLASEAGRAALLAQLDGADVLVENFKCGTMERWGLGFDALSERFPRLIHCRVSGFGADGPMGGMPGYDAAIQAMSGIMSVNGDPGGEPTRVGVPIVDMVTGMNAAIGVLLALQERQRSGRGQFVDIALFDCALSILHPHTASHFAAGATPGRTGNAHPNITPYDIFPTATDPLFLAVGNDRQFRILCEALGAAALADDPRYASNGQRCANRQALTRSLAALLSRHAAQGLAERLIRAGVPCSSVLDIPQALRHPQAVHREMVVQRDGYAGVASPVKLSRTPARYRMPPPRFGQHQLELDFPVASGR